MISVNGTGWVRRMFSRELSELVPKTEYRLHRYKQNSSNVITAQISLDFTLTENPVKLNRDGLAD